MSDVALLQRNSGYITRTYDTFESGCTRGVQKVCAFVCSMTRAAGGVLSIGYKKLGDKLHVSKTTIWRAVGQDRLGTDFVRERHGSTCTSYTYTGDLEQKIGPHVRTELFFYTEIFDGEIVKKGEKIRIERSLNDSEVDVFSLIYTHTLGRTGKFKGSPRTIARLLNMSYYTAWRALDMLLAFGLIFRPKKGVNAYSKASEYVANMRLIRHLKHTHKAKAQAKAEDEAERRAYYQAQELQRKAKADKYKEQVYTQVPSYREAFVTFKELETQAAKIEAAVELGQADVATLRIAHIKTQAQRERMAVIEKRMNIIPARFKPEYYGKKQCEHCFGTGQRSDEQKCDCWLRRQT